MTMVFAFALMLTIVAAMSVGVMLGRKPIAGSCGGMKALGLDTSCEVCGGDPNACKTTSGSKANRRAAELGVDASAGGNVRTL